MEELMGMTVEQIVAYGQQLVHQNEVVEKQIEADKDAEIRRTEQLLLKMALKLLPESLHPYTTFCQIKSGNTFTTMTHVPEMGAIKTWFGVRHPKGQDAEVFLASGSATFTVCQYRVQWDDEDSWSIVLDEQVGFDDLAWAMAYAAEFGDRRQQAEEEMRGHMQPKSEEAQYVPVRRSTAERLADLICELVAERQQF